MEQLSTQELIGCIASAVVLSLLILYPFGMLFGTIADPCWTPPEPPEINFTFLTNPPQ